jgi:hypothetical protein
MRSWQLVKGEFTPLNVSKDSTYFGINDSEINRIAQCIKGKKKNIVVLNDDEKNIKDFEFCKKSLIEAFEQILPAKSSFES